MTFVATDPPSHQGNTNTWLTPLSLVHSLGEFDLDPCGFPNHQTAKKLICLPEDGLNAEWFGRVWINPPYGKNTWHWLRQLQIQGNGIALIFARLETSWIQDFIKGGFFQIEGRIKFLKPDFIEAGNAGTGSILIPFGRKNIGAILQSDLKGQWFQ